MKRHKLGFRNQSIPAQLAICRRVADGIAGLPDAQRAALSEPDRNLGQRVTAAATAVARVETLRAELRAAKADRAAKVRAAREGATNAALGIWLVTQGDPAEMLRSGLELENDKRPVGAAAAPGNLRARATAFEGRVLLRWERPVRRCVFEVEMTADPAATTGWTNAGTTTRQKIELKGLASGEKCWFRVRAINAHGPGPWSNVACARAL